MIAKQLIQIMPRSFTRVVMIFLLFLITEMTLTPLLAENNPAEKKLAERWYVVELMEQRVGWTVMRKYQRGEAYHHEMLMQISIKRGPITIEIVMGSQFIESADGTPIRAIADQKMGQTASRTIYDFHPDHVNVTNIQSGRRWSQKEPRIEGKWLTPRQVEAFVEEKLKAEETKFSYRSIDPSNGLTPLTTTVEVGEKANVEVFGKVVPATLWRVTTSIMPDVVGVDYVDEAGDSLKSTVAIGGMEIALLAADEQTAKSPLDPPELLASTLVRIDRPIKKPREQRTAQYRLSVKAGKLPDLPTSPIQQFQRIDERQARLTINLDAPAGPKGERPAVKRSSMIDGEDDRIVALARRAVGETETGQAKAEAMRRFVYNYVDDKNLGVAMATASEVARTSSGDCTEHAVLLAAMLRAESIPSRVVTGLVYADGFVGERQIFGYHMWTQAWIDGRWIDLDATIDEANSFDATHITINTSELNDGEFDNDLVTLVPLLGRLEIEVLEPK